MKSQLQAMWQEGRLIVGMGYNPVEQGSMDLVSVLESLARRSPMLTGKHCVLGEVTDCDAVLSGHRTVSASKLRVALEDILGSQFLQQHRFDFRWNETTQRSHVQSVLTALKQGYQFYQGSCLKMKGISDCNQFVPSVLIGRRACSGEDRAVQNDCVYSELRLCPVCGDAGARFFDYSRFHGPLALFLTKHNRGQVMGQCEEFSRAGHALLSILGYKTRYVLDFTDHVWIEIWLPHEKRWVHADPSEGVLDNPLMYERNWGKNLTMIFAFTPMGIEHVTATYTEKYNETVRRRGISDEGLATVLEAANERLLYELPVQPWGHTAHDENADPLTLNEVALWSFFGSN